jgi:hypothetical protein
MDIFDAPIRDMACTRRQRTNTPLQALVLMNDPQWLEASRHLAERLIHEKADQESRLDYLGLLLLSRSWEPPETSILERMLDGFRTAYADNPDSAGKLVSVGESSRDETIPPTELAPWMLLASAALNLDDALSK